MPCTYIGLARFVCMHSLLATLQTSSKKPCLFNKLMTLLCFSLLAAVAGSDQCSSVYVLSLLFLELHQNTFSTGMGGTPNMW